MGEGDYMRKKVQKYNAYKKGTKKYRVLCRRIDKAVNKFKKTHRVKEVNIAIYDGYATAGITWLQQWTWCNRDTGEITHVTWDSVWSNIFQLNYVRDLRNPDKYTSAGYFQQSEKGWKIKGSTSNQ